MGFVVDADPGDKRSGAPSRMRESSTRFFIFKLELIVTVNRPRFGSEKSSG